MKKLLLHACCGPCLSGADAALGKELFDTTAYFYNPNIHDESEFIKRIEGLKSYLSSKGMKSYVDERYDLEYFKKEVSEAAGDRCVRCYTVRLNKAAGFAKANRFDAFSTTLLISPYQKHEKIKEVGEAASKEYGIEFIYRDMRSFYRESVEISKTLGIYRQKHCGCYLSEQEAKATSKRAVNI
jgi:epoxyqueuosine reductase